MTPEERAAKVLHFMQWASGVGPYPPAVLKEFHQCLDLLPPGSVILTAEEWDVIRTAVSVTDCDHVRNARKLVA